MQNPRQQSQTCGQQSQAVALHVAAVGFGDRVGAVDPFKLRISRGHGLGVPALTSVLRSGPAGTIPPGLSGNKAPK